MAPRLSPSTGSSPHARGTLRVLSIPVRRPRFIPTCAGNARHPASIRSWTTVHPRIRGERGRAVAAPGADCGSSPHTRGTLDDAQFHFLTSRFIPAYAGNACEKIAYYADHTVHPRIRGERRLMICSRWLISGSSPHTRGTPTQASLRVDPPRFIPAYAGNARHAALSGIQLTVHPRIRGERTSSKLLIYRIKSEPSDSTKRSGC